MDLSGNMSFFQQVQKAMSVGYYCLIWSILSILIMIDN